MLAIGVGSGVNYGELLAVAGSPADVYNITSFVNLTAIVGSICHKILGRISVPVYL